MGGSGSGRGKGTSNRVPAPDAGLTALFELKRRRWLWFRYWDWWCRKRHSDLSRLVKARTVFEEIKTEAEGLAAG